MPLTGPQARTQLADRGLNPSRTVGATTTPLAPGQVVTVDLVFQGRAVNGEDIFDALEAKYGAGKVVSDRDTLARGGPYSFRVLA
jgi:hypothetical protein